MNIYKCAFLAILFAVCSSFIFSSVEARHHSRTHLSFNIGTSCGRPSCGTYVIERHYPVCYRPYVCVPVRPYCEEVYVIPGYRERVLVAPRVQSGFNFGWSFGFGR